MSGIIDDVPVIYLNERDMANFGAWWRRVEFTVRTYGAVRAIPPASYLSEQATWRRHTAERPQDVDYPHVSPLFRHRVRNKGRVGDLSIRQPVKQQIIPRAAHAAARIRAADLVKKTRVGGGVPLTSEQANRGVDSADLPLHDIWRRAQCREHFLRQHEHNDGQMRKMVDAVRSGAIFDGTTTLGYDTESFVSGAAANTDETRCARPRVSQRLREVERAVCDFLIHARRKGQSCYGADSPGTLFAPGTRWNLSALATPLDFLDVDLPGVTSPMLYAGTLASCFAYHLEDRDLPAVNHLHFGRPKVWYVAPPADRDKVVAALAKIWPQDSAECAEFYRHKQCFVTPERLVSHHGVRLRRVVQLPGEFVVLHGGAFHGGFNLGFNLAEAVNFGSEYWLSQVAPRTTVCRCEKLRGISVDFPVHVLPARLQAACLRYPMHSHPRWVPAAQARGRLRISQYEPRFSSLKCEHRSLCQVDALFGLRVCHVDADNSGDDDDRGSTELPKKHDDTTRYLPPWLRRSVPTEPQIPPLRRSRPPSAPVTPPAKRRLLSALPAQVVVAPVTPSSSPPPAP